MMTIGEIRQKLSAQYQGLTSPDTKELIDSIMVYLNNYNQDKTIDLRMSCNWKERLLGEYLFLKDKLKKLHTTLIKIDAGTIKFKGNTTIEVLMTQEKHLTNYLHTLEVRMELEGINYED